jgi:peptide/nickel transport system permease protein
MGTLVIVFGAKFFGYLPPLTLIPFTDDPLGNLKQFLVPATVIAIGSSATTVRLVRSSMLEVLRQDYIRTAWAKGLRERRVLYRHALKNAILPVITLQGLQLGLLLSGSVIVEIVFGIPGLGRLAFDSVNQRDYTVLQGLVLLFGLIFVVTNFLVDLSYAWLDPRVKQQY